MKLEQHFLNVKNNNLENIILNKIKDLKENRIIELGSGKGDLTKLFAKSKYQIVA